MDHVVMRICILYRFSIICAQKWCFVGFEGEDVKILSSDPQKHYPAWIRVCWCIACQNRFDGLSSRSVERVLRTKKEIKKGVVTLAIWGEVTPGATLTKCGVWRTRKFDHVTPILRELHWLPVTQRIQYGGRNHVCNIRWLSVKGCGCGERGKFSFSHWLDASPLQHWSHYRVTVW